MFQTVTWEMSKRHVWGVMSRGLILKSVIIIMKHIAAVSVLVRGWEDERPKAQELDSEQRRHKRLCRRKTTGINAGKVPSWLIWKLWWDSFFCYPQPRSGATVSNRNQAACFSTAEERPDHYNRHKLMALCWRLFYRSHPSGAVDNNKLMTLCLPSFSNSHVSSRRGLWTCFLT